MRGGGNFTVYDMLIGNPSFVVEKEKSKKYDWMNKLRVVYKIVICFFIIIYRKNFKYCHFEISYMNFFYTFLHFK